MNASADQSLIERGAKFSQCRRWRYMLWRRWGDGPCINFILLNPSTADENRDDQSVERCQRIATKLGFSALQITSLFAFCATTPLELHSADDPVGPGNDAALRVVATESALVICGWGNHGRHLKRSRDVVAMLAELKIPLHALHITPAGEPGLPLYLGYGRQPTRFA